MIFGLLACAPFAIRGKTIAAAPALTYFRKLLLFMSISPFLLNGFARDICRRADNEASGLQVFLYLVEEDAAEIFVAKHAYTD